MSADHAAGQFRVVRPDVTQQPVVEEPDAERETLLIDVGGEAACGLERAFVVGSVRRGADYCGRLMLGETS